MGIAGVNQVAVDFVGADDQIVAQAEISDAFQFLLRVDTPDRVMRVTEQKELRLRRDSGFERVEVDLVVENAVAERRSERCGLRESVIVQRHFEEGRINRRLHENRRPRRADRATDRVQAKDQTRHEDDLIAGSVHVMTHAQPLDQQSAQFRAVELIAENAVIDALVERLDDRLRRQKIHIGDPQRNDFIRVLRPLFTVVLVTPVNEGVEIDAHL